MNSLRSILAGGSDTAATVAKQWVPHFAQSFPQKYYWFVKSGYVPHEWQTAFHSAERDGKLVRFRHLAAGRRGGKTLSAAWETLFYCLFPHVFHQDAHALDSNRPLHVWVLAKDHEVGRASRDTFAEVIEIAQLVKGKDYEWNKTEKLVTFLDSGSRLQFKTAEDPQSLRGAGLDILWIDEAAFIVDDQAWQVVRPALSDKVGVVYTTSTPKGKNWFYDRFFHGQALENKNQWRVEYTSIDNPHFSREEWEDAKLDMHPIMFKQEYLASFDSMSGIALQGDWLKYYSLGQPESDEIVMPRSADGSIRLHKFLGIDPAISLADTADHFAMALIGVTEDRSQAFLLKTFKERIPFPDQVDVIREWWLEHKPEYIGIEAIAYQRALEQQIMRLEGLPPVQAVFSRGKKWERILSMAPTFKTGRIRIHRSHQDFIDEWISYDPEIKNPKDDLLDAVDIALGAAGVIRPSTEWEAPQEPKTLDEEAWAHIRAKASGLGVYDDELGSEA